MTFKFFKIRRKSLVSNFQGTNVGIFKKHRRKTCIHVWEKPFRNNSSKRKCKVCGRVEWIVQRRPSFDKPSLDWKFIRYED